MTGAGPTSRSWTRSAHGGREWRDLDSLQRETLAAVLARHAIDLPAGSQEALVRGWRQLQPWPDTRAGLDRLRRGHITATLSNGHVALLADLLKFGDLRVDAVLSAQLAGGYKPDPRVYLTALRLLECPPEEAAMVACHTGDLRAAAALGLRPAYIERPLESGPAVPRDRPRPGRADRRPQPDRPGRHPRRLARPGSARARRAA